MESKGGKYMTTYELRARIPADIYKRFKVLCVKLDLSMPKQTAEIVKKFVEVQEDNQEKLKSIKKDK